MFKLYLSSVLRKVPLRLNFLFTKTQSEDVQRDAGYRRFMWVQCKLENKSVCAQKVDSPDFFHSFQEKPSSEYVELPLTFNSGSGKHTYGTC